MQKEIIDFNDIDKSLHQSGLFKAIPSTFKYLGKIQKQFHKNTVVCFYLELEEISIGDELMIQDKNDYFVQTIKEMMVDGEKVDKAEKEEKLSIKLIKPVTKQANIYLK